VRSFPLNPRAVGGGVLDVGETTKAEAPFWGRPYKTPGAESSREVVHQKKEQPLRKRGSIKPPRDAAKCNKRSHVRPTKEGISKKRD